MVGLFLTLLLFSPVAALPQRSHPDDQPSNLVYGGRLLHRPIPTLVVLTREDLPREVNGFFCGGSILNNRYVLTAAHCAAVMIGDVNSTIYAGVSSLRQMDGGDGIQSVAVKSVKMHPEFDNQTYANDIAVVELDGQLTFTKTVQPTRIFKTTLSPKNLLVNGSTSLGLATQLRTVDSTPMPDNHDLHYAITPLVDRETCRKAWIPFETPITDKQICTSSKRVGLNHGDSGSPIFYYEKNRSIRSSALRQIGIVANGEVGNQDVPDYSIRTAAYCDWIEEQTDRLWSCL